MGGMSWIHWLLLGGVALVLFGGRGKVSELLGDLGKGVSSFKKGLAEKEEPEAIDAQNIEKHETSG